MPNLDIVEIVLQNDLWVFVLDLEIIAYNGHGTLICRVVYMTH